MLYDSIQHFQNYSYPDLIVAAKHRGAIAAHNTLFHNRHNTPTQLHVVHVRRKQEGLSFAIHPCYDIADFVIPHIETHSREALGQMLPNLLLLSGGTLNTE